MNVNNAVNIVRPNTAPWTLICPAFEVDVDEDEAVDVAVAVLAERGAVMVPFKVTTVCACVSISHASQTTARTSATVALTYEDDCVERTQPALAVMFKSQSSTMVRTHASIAVPSVG